MRCFCCPKKQKNSSNLNARPTTLGNPGAHPPRRTSRSSALSANVVSPTGPSVAGANVPGARPVSPTSGSASATAGTNGFAPGPAAKQLSTPDPTLVSQNLAAAGVQIAQSSTAKQYGTRGTPGSAPAPPSSTTAEKAAAEKFLCPQFYFNRMLIIICRATETLWEQAMAQLQPEDLQGINIDLKNKTKLSILQLFIQEAEEAKKECESKQWSYVNSGGEKVLVRESVDSLLVNVKRYASLGDNIVQALPSPGSLVWGGLKLLLQLAITEMDNTRIALESLDALARILGHCSIYETLYSQDLKTSQSLNASLVRLYVLVLKFLCYIRHRLGLNTAARGVKNLGEGVSTRWTELLAAESEVDKEAGIAQQEAAGRQSYFLNEMMQRMLQVLEETSEPIHQIQATVEATQITVKDIFKTLEDNERTCILTWLSQLSPTQHHDFNKSFRTDGTGGWLMDKESFRKWKDVDASSLLWLHGIAGSGKTTLASMIIDVVANDPQTNGHSLAYFYCYYGEEKRRDPGEILRSLVKQLCLQSPVSKLPEPVLSIYHKRKTDGDLSNLLSVEESKRLLIELCGGFSHSMIIIDGLDECDAKTRGRLFDVLQNVVSESKTTRVKAFVTSRDDADVRKKFSDSPNVYIQERDNSGDINTYIRAEIDARIAEKRLLEGDVSSELRARIIHALEAGARGMFIWVKYQINKICDEDTPLDVEQALTEPAHDLNQMYAEILNTMRTRHSSTRRFANAENILKWVFYAVEPLSPQTLIEAISFTNTSDRRQALTLPTILDICQNLIVLDGELGILRFAHFSVHEFLRERYPIKEGNTDLARVCLTLLTTSNTTQIEESQKPSFVHYACFNWPEHYRLSGGEDSGLQNLWKTLLAPSPLYESWVSRVSDVHYALRARESEILAPLLVACHFRLQPILEDLLHSLHNKEDLNCVNQHGETAIYMAVGMGNEKAVQTLLEKEGVEVNSGPYRQNALDRAIEGKYPKVVKMLLEKEEVKVNQRNRDGETELCVVAKMNDKEMALEMTQILLAREQVDADSAGDDGRTPLSWAAWKGHEGVVQLLLTRGVGVNKQDKDGRSPLSWAASGGHQRVMQLLLSNKMVNANSRDNLQKTPLSWGAEAGNERAVQLLLEIEEVDVNNQDVWMQNPLSWAMQKKHERVVQMLLEKGAIDTGVVLEDGSVCSIA
ncbi:hypothetical protein Q9L58_010249 [Maublancomyces gigas]|uniref:NACHT domain-containing protein n=1 Tax=Discina gigas TaxID=1032678 RepID=A0ABR3G515_9PEZI